MLVIDDKALRHRLDAVAQRPFVALAAPACVFGEVERLGDLVDFRHTGSCWSRQNVAAGRGGPNWRSESIGPAMRREA